MAWNVYQRRDVRLSGVAFFVTVVLTSITAGAAKLDTSALPPPAARAVDFVEDVQPIFAASCYSCHGPDKHKSGYRLDVKSVALTGGDLGGSIVPGKSADSPLVHYVGGLDEDMQMPPKGEKLSAEQVGILRAWIDQGAAWPESADAAKVKDKADHWAFKPATRPAAPQVEGLSHPIDAFVRARLAQEKLTPSPGADRRTLIRRLSFDLTGLPPTPSELDAFITDARPNAYELLVDRLLASPRYGERWARHWLDVVHFGESHGYDKDKPRPHAWPYRDYVIRAFNEDKPYSRFVKEQLAGDVLYPNSADGIVATGFIAAGPWDFVGHVELREGTSDKELTRSNDRDDMVMTTMSTFQSLTVHCARCHNHKFDPITQEDYYRLQAVFGGVDRGDRPYEADGQSGQVYAAVPLAKSRPVHFLLRGDVKQPKQLMAAGSLEVFAGEDMTFSVDNADNEGARRAALAEWITGENNLLTRRSIVNRVWHYHFGAGLVDSPNDFGHMGAMPTHSELLDWLAYWFVDNGESLKALHRLIVTSATYRQFSAPNPAHETIDADNRYLWRMNRTRLDAESLRDAILAVTGKLDETRGGPSARQFSFTDGESPVYDYTHFDVDDPGSFRRSIYRFIVRSVPDPFMDTLDCPDPSVLAPKRNTTLTALQALALLNNPFVVRQAEHFAARVATTSADPAAQVEMAYRLSLSRDPTAEELKLMTDYAAKFGLANACRILFNSNEFVFVD